MGGTNSSKTEQKPVAAPIPVKTTSSYQPSNHYVGQTKQLVGSQSNPSSSGLQTYSSEYATWLNTTCLSGHAEVTPKTVTPSNPGSVGHSYHNREVISSYQSHNQEYGQVTQVKHDRLVTQGCHDVTERTAPGNLKAALKTGTQQPLCDMSVTTAPGCYNVSSSYKPLRPTQELRKPGSSTSVTQQPSRDRAVATAPGCYNVSSSYKPLRPTQELRKPGSSTSVTQQPLCDSAVTTAPGCYNVSSSYKPPIRPTQELRKPGSGSNVTQQPSRDMSVTTAPDCYNVSSSYKPPIRSTQDLRKPGSGSNVTQQPSRDRAVATAPGCYNVSSSYKPLRPTQELRKPGSSTSVTQQPSRDMAVVTAPGCYNVSSSYKPLKPTQELRKPGSSTSVTQQPSRGRAMKTVSDYHNVFFSYKPLRPTQVLRKPGSSTSVTQQPSRDMAVRTASYDQLSSFHKPLVTQDESGPSSDMVTQVSPYVTQQQPPRKVQTPENYFAFDPLSGSVTQVTANDRVTHEYNDNNMETLPYHQPVTQTKCHMSVTHGYNDKAARFPDKYSSIEIVRGFETQSPHQDPRQRDNTPDNYDVMGTIRNAVTQEETNNYVTLGRPQRHSIDVGIDAMTYLDGSSQSSDGDDSDDNDECYTTEKQQRESKYKAYDSDDDDDDDDDRFGNAHENNCSRLLNNLDIDSHNGDDDSDDSDDDSDDSERGNDEDDEKNGDSRQYRGGVGHDDVHNDEYDNADNPVCVVDDDDFSDDDEDDNDASDNTTNNVNDAMATAEPSQSLESNDVEVIIDSDLSDEGTEEQIENQANAANVSRPVAVLVLVQVTFATAMHWKKAEYELKKATNYSKFKFVGQQKNVHKKTYCVSFPSRKLSKNAMYLLKRNKIKAVLCRDLLETCKEKINQERETALASHDKKLEEVTQKMMTVQKESAKKKKTKFYSLDEFEKREALKETAKELNGQTKEFVQLTNELLQTLESLKDVFEMDVCAQIDNVEQRFQREKDRLNNGLPIYAEKSRIIETIKNNQVCIILGETGSGKSTQIVQYLYDAGFADKQTIVCTQPRKVAAFSLGRRVSEELRNPKLVDCIEQCRHRKSSILFTTDHALLMKCLRDRDLSQYSCVVIDEAHERNINTDLLLGIIKKAVLKRPDLRVVVTSATIDPTLFQEYFGSRSCPVIKVSGRLFPVEIEWKKSRPEASTSVYSGDYVSEAVDKVVEICRSNEAGDVLVFLTCPAEIEQACKALSSKVNTSYIICLPLHGKLQQEDQQKVFDSTPLGKRKVVISTNCAETSLTIPGIKFVIDSGRVKEMKYDQKRNMSSLEIAIVSQSSANQRKGRAGRTDSGKCFRLYTEEEFNAMEKSSKPEILRVHLGQALLKLMDLGIDNPADFDYVESPPLESIRAAMAELEELEATREGKLTDLGKKMARVPVDPRLGKFLFEGFNQEVGYEALVLVSISTITGSVFFRMGSDEEKKRADDKKVEFCQLGGDLMTLLDVFRKWLDVNEQERGRWCYNKSLNAKSMRMAYETVKDLKMVLKRDLKIDGIQWAPFDREATDAIIQRTLFKCFLTNLCVFTGHEKVGYQTVNGGRFMKVHPSSAIKVMGEYPKFVVYEKVLKTTQEFILNVTPIEEIWLTETITEPNLLSALYQLLEEKFVKRTITCSQNLIMETLYPPKDKIPEVEKHVSLACGDRPAIVEMNKKEACVDIFVSGRYATKGEEAMQNVLEDGRKRLRQQADEFVVEGARSLQVVIESGLTVQHILMPGMFRTVFSPHFDPEVVEFLKSQGDVIDVSSNRKQQLFLTFKSPSEAKAAVNLAKQLDMDVQPKLNNTQSRGEFNFVLDISWQRRKPKGTARVVYSNPVPWYDLPLRWSLSATVKSRPVRITADKFHMDAIFVRNLDPTATKRDIKEALVHVFPEYDKELNIFIHFEQRDANQEVPPQDQKSSLETLVERCISSRNFEVSVKPIQPDCRGKAVYGFAQVRFTSHNEGMMVAKKLQNVGCTGLERWPVQLQVRPKLDFYYTSLKSVYALVKHEVEQQIEEIAESCGLDCGLDLSLKVAPLGKSANSNRVKLSIATKCIDHYVETAAVLSTAIQGDVFDCTEPQERLPLLYPTSKDTLAMIQKATGTLICSDSRRKAFVIYGTKTQKKRASADLERSVAKLASDDSIVWEINLKGPNKPRGLLKQMMATFGCELERLCEVEGVLKITKCLFKHVITVQSTKEAKEEVLRRVEEVERTLPQYQPRPEANQDNDSEDCPVCLCEVDIDGPYFRLSTCGHAHCKECITAQLKSAASFPLACAAENCGEKIVVKDLQSLLQTGKDQNDFVNMTLRSYMDRNQEKAKYCPSPDCPMVYLVTEDAQSFQCDICSATICTSCHKPYHLGMTCKEYENDLKDPGAREFQEWMERDPETRKRCPIAKCNTPIEKNEGCNHMQCGKCKAHFCWMCLKVCRSAAAVYGHQGNCPGRPMT